MSIDPTPIHASPVVSTPLPNLDNNTSPITPQGDPFLNEAIAQSLKKPLPVTVPGLTTSYNYQDAKPFLSGFGHSGFAGNYSAEYNAENQRWYHQLTNGVVKGIGLAGGTFIDGTIGLLNGVGGIVASALNGKVDLSRMYDNTTTNAVNQFTESMEKWFPNYYSQKEKDASAFSTDNLLTMNFLADKLIKNAGFAVGAIGSGYATAGLGAALKVGKLATVLNRGIKSGAGIEALTMSAGDDVVNASMRAMELAQKQSINASKVESKFLHEMGMTLSTVGEANMEALEGVNRVKMDLTNQEVARLGRPLTPEENEKIENAAKKSGNQRWALNVALLNVTNRLVFPKIMGGNFSTPRQIAGRELNDIVVQNAEKKVLNKSIAGAGENYAQKEIGKNMGKLAQVWDVAKKPFGLVSGAEMFEEGAQFAFEQATAKNAGISEYDYSTRGWLNRDNDGESKSLLEDIISFGIPQVFNTKEGLESLILGGLTGGIMQQIGGGERKENAQRIQNTGTATGLFNTNTSTAYMSELFKSGVRTVTQESEHANQVAKGDIFNATNVREDGFLNFALPRLYYGRKDMAIDELQQFKSDKMDFNLAKQQLGLPDTFTAAQLDAEIDKQVKNIEELSKLVTHIETIQPLSYNKDGSINQTTKGMLYSLYKVHELDKRLSTLTSDLSQEGLTDLNLLTDVKARKEANKSLEEVRNSLTQELRENLKGTTKDPIAYLQKLNDIERIQNARERYINDYDQLRNNKFFSNSLMKYRRLDDTTTLDDYKNFESSSLQDRRVGIYEHNSEARRLAAELSIRMEEKLSNNVPISLLEISELESLLASNNAYLLEADKNHIKSLINQSKNKIKQTTALNPSAKNPEWQSLSDADIQEINDMDMPTLEQYSQMSDDEIDDDYRQAVRDRMGLLESAEQSLTKFAEVEKQLDSPDRNTIPETSDMDQVKRKIADDFKSISDAVVEAYNLDKEGYTDLEMAEASLTTLKNLRRIFNERDDIFKNKGFPEKAEYLKELDDAIAVMEDVILQTKKNIENVEKEDVEFAKNNHNDKAKIIGYDTETDTVLIPSLFNKIKELIGETKLMELLKQHKGASNPKFIYELYQHLRNVLATTAGSTESLNQIITPLIADLKTKIEAAKKLSTRWSIASNTDILFETPYNHYDYFIKMIFGDNSEVGVMFNKGRNIKAVIDYLKANPTTQSQGVTVSDFINFLENAESLKSLVSLKQIIELEPTFNYVKYWQAVEAYVEQLQVGNIVPTMRQLQVIEDLVLNHYTKADTTEDFGGWAYMDGRIGSGKTKVIAKGFISILQTLLNKSNINDVAVYMGDITVAAINLEMGLGTSQNISTNGSAVAGGLNLEDLIIRLEANDPFFKTYGVILGDEMARPSNADVTRLAKALSAYNKQNGSTIKFVGMGDVNQMSENMGSNNKITTLNSKIKLTTQLATSYRSLIFSINVVQQIFDKAGVENVLRAGNVKLVSNASDSETDWFGVTGVTKGTSFDDAESQVIAKATQRSKSIRQQKKGPPSVLVVVNEGQEDIIKKKLIAAGADMSVLDVFSVKQSQGLTYDEVFIHLNPKAAEFKDEMLLYNSSMYTAVRGRYYIHVSTLEAENINDQSLADRFHELFNKMQVTQGTVKADVTDIQKHLSTIFDPEYLKQQAAKNSAPPNSAPPAPNAPPASAPPIYDQTQDTNNEPEEPINEDDLKNDTLDEIPDSSGFIPNDSIPDNFIKVANPTSYAFKFNNLGFDHMLTEGEPIMLVPVMPSAGYSNKDAIRWNVMRPFIVNGITYYQELGVLGEDQVQDMQNKGLLPVVNPENRYSLQPQTWVKQDEMDFVNSKLFRFDIKGLPFNDNDPFNNSNIVSTVLKSATELRYNYDYGFNPGIQGNEFRDMQKLIATWIDGMFEGQLDKADRDGILKVARIVIFSDSNSAYFKEIEKRFKAENSQIPFKPGGAYIEIDPSLYPNSKFKTKLPQYIELQGRNLQMNTDVDGNLIESENNTVMNEWYIKPLRNYVAAAKQYHSDLMGVLNTLGISEDLLADVAASTSQPIENTGAVLEEDVTEFKQGNSIYNKLMQKLVNMHHIPDPNASNAMAEKLFDDIFRNLTLDQKKLLINSARNVYTIVHGTVPTRQVKIDKTGKAIDKDKQKPDDQETPLFVNIDTYTTTLVTPDDVDSKAKFIFEVLNLNKAGAPLGSAQAALNHLAKANSKIKINNADGSITHLNLGIFEKEKNEAKGIMQIVLKAPKLTSAGSPKLFKPTSLSFDNLFTNALLSLYGPQAFKVSMYQAKKRFELALQELSPDDTLDSLSKEILAIPEDTRFESDAWQTFLEITNYVYTTNKRIGHTLDSIENDILGGFGGSNGSHSFGNVVYKDRFGNSRQKPVGLKMNIPINMSDTDTRGTTFSNGNKNVNSPFLPTRMSKDVRFRNFFTSSFLSVDSTKLEIGVPEVKYGNTPSTPTGTPTATLNSEESIVPDIDENQIVPAPGKDEINNIEEDEDEDDDPIYLITDNPNHYIPDEAGDPTPTGNAIAIENEMFEYLQRFIPGLTRSEFQLLNSLQASTVFGPVNGRVWGAFKEGIIYAVQGNKNDAVFKQVLKHEAFHKIFRQYVNANERNLIIHQAKIEYNLWGLSDLQIEEYLAVNFQRRPDVEIDNSLLQRFLNFIKKIYNLIFKNATSIEDFYKNIEAGRFKQPVAQSNELKDTAFLHTLDLFKGKEYYIPVLQGLYLNYKTKAGKEDTGLIQPTFNDANQPILTNMPKSSYDIAVATLNRLKRKLEGNPMDRNVPGLKSRYFQSHSLVYYKKTGDDYIPILSNDLLDYTNTGVPLYTNRGNDYIPVAEHNYPQPLSAEEVLQMNALMHLFSQHDDNGYTTAFFNTDIYPIFLTFVNQYYPQDLPLFKKEMNYSKTVKSLKEQGLLDEDADIDNIIGNKAEDEATNDFSNSLATIIDKDKAVDPYATLGTSVRTWLSGIFITNEKGQKVPINVNQALAILYQRFEGFPTADMDAFLQSLDNSFSDYVSQTATTIYDTQFIMDIIKKGNSSKEYQVLLKLKGGPITQADAAMLSTSIKSKLEQLIHSLLTKGVITEDFDTDQIVNLFDLYSTQRKKAIYDSILEYSKKYKAADNSEKLLKVQEAFSKITGSFEKSGNSVKSGNPTEIALFEKLYAISKRALATSTIYKKLDVFTNTVKEYEVAFDPFIYFENEGTFNLRGVLYKIEYKDDNGKRRTRTLTEFFMMIKKALEHKDGNPSLADYNVIAAMFYKHQADQVFKDVVTNFNTLTSANLTKFINDNTEYGGRIFKMETVNENDDEYKSMLNLHDDIVRSLKEYKPNSAGEYEEYYSTARFTDFINTYSNSITKTGIIKVDKALLAAAYRDFMTIIGLQHEIRTDYTQSQIRNVVSKIANVIDGIKTHIPVTVKVDDSLDLSVKLSESNKSDLRYISNFNKAVLQSSITTVKDVNGNRRFLKDRITYAHKMLNRFASFQSKNSDALANEFPQLTSQLYYLNPFNPLGYFKTTLGVNSKVQTLDGTLNKDFPVTLEKESKKDIVSRMLNGYFVGTFLGPVGIDNNRNVMASPYPISDKSKTTMVKTKPYKLSGSNEDNDDAPTSRDMIQKMLEQRLMMPLTNTKLKTYSVWEQQGKSVLAGLTPEHIKELTALTTGYADYNDFKSKKINLEKYIDAITKELDRQASELIDYIFETNEMALAITKGSYISNKYRIPLPDNLQELYNNLIESKYLEISDFGDSSLFTIEGDTVKVNNYDPNGKNKDDVQKEHLMPLVRLFMNHTYINDYFLNQITAGDIGYFKNGVDFVKRLSSAWGNRMNPIVSQSHAPSTLRTLVVEDIAIYSYTGFEPDTDNVNMDENINMPDKFKRHYSPSEYEEMITKLKEAGDLEKLKTFKSVFKEIELTDGAGWMSERGRDHINKGFGHAFKLGNSIKPIAHDLDKSPFNNKYALTVITDVMAQQFPHLLDIRIQMDFHGLKSNPGKYARAVELERKRLNREASMSLKEIIELNKLFHDQFLNYDTLPAYQTVPLSSIKYGKLKATTKFDYNTRQYANTNPDAILDIDMNNWGQQLDPTDEAESKVSLPTQLLYFANTNGTSAEVSNRISNALMKMQELAETEFYEAGLTPSTEYSADEALRGITNVVSASIAGNENHINTAHALAHNYRMANLPAFSNSVVSSYNTYFQKSFLSIKFNGTKGVQVTQGLTENMNGENLKWDPVTQTAEAYMPRIYQKQILAANPDLYKKWLSEDNPSKKLALEKEILASLPLTSLGYRIPSTGINSAVKIKIKGFLNDTENRVILPHEVTSKMGSDFDIDVLYIIRPNLYGAGAKDQAIAAYFQSSVSKAIGITDDETVMTDFEDKLNSFNTVVSLPGKDQKGNERDFRITAHDKKKIKKAYYENVFMYSYIELLSSEENRPDANKSISFDRVNSIIPMKQKDGSMTDSLFAVLAGFKNSKFKAAYEDARDNVEKGLPLYSDINVQNHLNDWMNEIMEKSYNLTNFTDRMEMQLLNQTGKAMTGVFASVTKTLAYLQEAIGPDFKVGDGFEFTFNGQTWNGSKTQFKDGRALFTDINGISTFDELQWLVNAAVDNAKEQILAKMNMNVTTANVITGSLLMGIPVQDTLVLLNQPVARALSDIGTIDKSTILYMSHRIMGSLGDTTNVAQRIENLLATTQIGIEKQGMIDISKFVSVDLFKHATTIRPYLTIDTMPELNINHLRKFTYENRVYQSIHHAYNSNRTGIFNQKEYDNFDVSDTSDIKPKGEQKTILSALVEASLLQAPNDLAKSLNAYSILEFENASNSNFNVSMIQGIDNARKVHESNYMLENGLSSNDETFIASQLAVLKLIEKLQDLGNAVSKVQRVLNIMNNNPNQPSDIIGFEDVMADVFQVENTIDNSNILIKNVGKEKKIELPVNPFDLQVLEKFPLQNIDFNKINLFNTTYHNWMKLGYSYFEKGIHVLNPQMKELVNSLMQTYNIGPTSNGDNILKPAEKNMLIRNLVIKALFSKTFIVTPDLDGNKISIPMDTSNLVYNNGNMTYTGNRALAEEIITLYKKSRNNENLVNYFFGKLVIQPFNNFTGNQDITMTRTQTSDINEVNAIKSSFLQLDNEQRKEFMNNNPDYKGYWYSPLQLKLIQYAAINEGLTFGNTKISMFLPNEIMDQFANQMDDIFKDLVRNQGLNELKDWLALQTVVTNRDWAKLIRNGELSSNEEGESSKLETAIFNEKLDETEDTGLGKKKSIKARTMKYDNRYGIHYHLLVTTNGDPKKMPVFRNYGYKNKTYTYMRLNTPLENGSYYVLLPTVAEAQIKIPDTVLQQGFSLEQLMEGKTALINEKAIIPNTDGLYDLFTGSEFPLDSFVYGYDNTIKGYLQHVNKYKVVLRNAEGKDDVKFKELLDKKAIITKSNAENKTELLQEINLQLEQLQIVYKLELVDSGKTIQQLLQSTNSKTQDLLLTTNQNTFSVEYMNLIKEIDGQYGNGTFDARYWTEDELRQLNNVQQQLKCK